MLIAGCDIETTGLEPGDHRIIEVYVGLWDLETRTLVEELNQRIDPQRSIMAAAQAVHKISINDLEGCPSWPFVVDDVRAILAKADLHVGHNWEGFDLPFINYELKRVGKPTLSVPYVDTMLCGRWATHNGAVPNLGALCFACDVPYDTSAAHAADYDVKVMMECFFKALDWEWFKLPEHLAPALPVAA